MTGVEGCESDVGDETGVDVGAVGCLAGISGRAGMKGSKGATGSVPGLTCSVSGSSVTRGKALLSGEVSASATGVTDRRSDSWSPIPLSPAVLLSFAFCSSGLLGGMYNFLFHSGREKIAPP